MLLIGSGIVTPMMLLMATVCYVVHINSVVHNMVCFRCKVWACMNREEGLGHNF